MDLFTGVDILMLQRIDLKKIAPYCLAKYLCDKTIFENFSEFRGFKSKKTINTN